MGKDCLQIFLNLKLSSEQQQDIHECIEALEAYFKPKRNVVYERYLFNMCQQNPDELMDGYVSRLRKAASICQFGTLTEEIIRDQLVISLRDHATKLRLLKEDSLDINKALNICRSSEVATLQLKAMKSEETKSAEEVHAVSGRQNNKVKSRNQYNGKKKICDPSSDPRKHREPNFKQRAYLCYRWGGKQRHTLENYPAFGHECKACKKPSHFASVCRSSQKHLIKQMTELSDDEQEGDTDKFFYKLEEVSSVQARGRRLYTSLGFADPNARYKTKLDCQLDTGATCNVLTHRDLSVICQTGHPALQAKQSEVPTVSWRSDDTSFL